MNALGGVLLFLLDVDALLLGVIMGITIATKIVIKHRDK